MANVWQTYGFVPDIAIQPIDRRAHPRGACQSERDEALGRLTGPGTVSLPCWTGAGQTNSLAQMLVTGA
jgi:hypothetical protein